MTTANINKGPGAGANANARPGADDRYTQLLGGVLKFLNDHTDELNALDDFMSTLPPPPETGDAAVVMARTAGALAARRVTLNALGDELNALTVQIMHGGSGTPADAAVSPN